MIKNATDLQDPSKMSLKMTEEIDELTDNIIKSQNNNDALLLVQFLLSSMQEGVKVKMLPRTAHKCLKKLMDSKLLGINELNNINYFINAKHDSVCNFLELSFIRHRNTLKDAFNLENITQFIEASPQNAWNFLLKGNRLELFNGEILEYCYKFFDLNNELTKKNEFLCSFTSVKHLLKVIPHINIKSTDIVEPTPGICNRLLQYTWKMENGRRSLESHERTSLSGNEDLLIQYKQEIEKLDNYDTYSSHLVVLVGTLSRPTDFNKTLKKLEINKINLEVIDVAGNNKVFSSKQRLLKAGQIAFINKVETPKCNIDMPLDNILSLLKTQCSGDIKTKISLKKAFSQQWAKNIKYIDFSHCDEQGNFLHKLFTVNINKYLACYLPIPEKHLMDTYDYWKDLSNYDFDCNSYYGDKSTMMKKAYDMFINKGGDILQKDRQGISAFTCLVVNSLIDKEDKANKAFLESIKVENIFNTLPPEEQYNTLCNIAVRWKEIMHFNRIHELENNANSYKEAVFLFKLVNNFLTQVVYCTNLKKEDEIHFETLGKIIKKFTDNDSIDIQKLIESWKLASELETQLPVNNAKINRIKI